MPTTPIDIPADLFARKQQRREEMRRVAWKHELHTGQAEVYHNERRFRIVSNGRRWGKSFEASREAVDKANAAQAKVLLTAPTYKTAENGVWAHLLNDLPSEYRKVNHGKLTVNLTGGGVVQVGSLEDPDNLRGAGVGLCGIIIDEAAFVPDYAVESVLRPMLMDCNGWLLAISTPKGRRGWFYRYWLRGQSSDPRDAAYKSWQMPTWTNPTLPNLEQEIEDLRSSMPENVFRQEIGAEFVDDVGQVFRDVALAETAERQLDGRGKPLRTDGADYYIGIDFARSGSDYTVVTVLEKLANGDLRLAWIDRWGRLADEAQIDRLAQLLTHFKPRRTIAEENAFGGVYCSWMQSKHQIMVELFKTSGTSKEPLIQQLAAALEFHRLALWSSTDPLGRVISNELLSYERQVSPAGNATYSAPQGYHDDCVMSLAFAVRAAEGDPATIEAGHFDGPADSYMLRDGIWAPRTDNRGMEVWS
jgi:hypothetical protein